MNTENLNGILAQYIQHCKSRTAADEGTIWRAVDCFGVNWDIDDSDFRDYRYRLHAFQGL